VAVYLFGVMAESLEACGQNKIGAADVKSDAFRRIAKLTRVFYLVDDLDDGRRFRYSEGQSAH